jgi:N-acetylmuramoyl-L-alanine amidase-like protein
VSPVTFPTLDHPVPALWLPHCDQVRRVILHWTGGGPYPSLLERGHYHLLIDQHGTVHKGLFPIGRWPSHTRMLNTGSVGIALCGMRGAAAAPFQAGPAPINERQVTATARAAAAVLHRYGILPTERTCLTHCEVTHTYGLAQRGKWDISWMPGMSHPMPNTAGDRLRWLVRLALKGELPGPTAYSFPDFR